MDENVGKSELALNEEKILKFWQENKIFEKSLEKKSPKGEFVFFEGPPTANGHPGIHHFEARAFKDVLPRYKTMQGFHVRRKAGWDTHGLPVELQVEKELGLKSKKEIEDYGIAEFNKKCKESVWKYLTEWNEFTTRMGFWLDQENPYITYKASFMESVWAVIKKVNDQNLLFKDYKIVPWCPRCGTGLSSHELAQGYENVKDLSVYVKFKIKGKENEYILAWTTTPWTLPGNITLAVGENIDYVKIEISGEFFILAKARLSVIDGEYKIIEEIKGKDLINLGLEYEPLYHFLNETISGPEKEKLNKAYKIYPANFVTTEDGTGVVHTAVMYGQDDFELGTKIGLPKHHLVGLDGKFLTGTGFLEGRFVRDEDVAVDVIKDLASRNLLFKKEKYEHSYPHCWRCHTALIYYARDSWYIRMTELRDKLVKENEGINWEPEYIKDGRFGEWLRDIKDWAISRERYWGTPLPVWNCEKCKKMEVLGSVDDLKQRTKKSGNKYFGMRHGQGEHNVLNVCSGVADFPHHLTENGIAHVKEMAEKLKEKNITKIIISPFVRTKETAKIVASIIGFPEDQIIIDERLHEYNFGEFNGKPKSEFNKWQKEKEDFFTAPKGGESCYDAKKRISEFLYDIDRKFQNENILFVSHGIAFELLPSILNGDDALTTWKNWQEEIVSFGDFQEYNFIPIPHNDDFELDIHKPYIDDFEILCSSCGGKMIREKEVLDVWFDSGAMPFAQDHYPFENKEWIDGGGYPADFISEAIDQTRGWFYTLHAIGVLVGKGKAYKNVICLGHLLDEKGKKMSKHIGNVVDPWIMMDKYGVDALRFWMYSVNQAGDSKNFDEKTVDEVVKKTFNILNNIVKFYEMFPSEDVDLGLALKSENVLDKWIITKFNKLLKDTTVHLDTYHLLEPSRNTRDFILDFSQWYIRRSRDRFKGGDEKDKNSAMATTKFILLELSKLMAPLTPFIAEEIYQKVKGTDGKESVHLEDWSKAGEINEKTIEDMQKTREIVSQGLDVRTKAGIKVKQPLASLKLKMENGKLSNGYLELIKDEMNVKEVVLDDKIENDLVLDTEITEELKQEGLYREFFREVQELRKKENLTTGDTIVLFIETENGKDLIQKFEQSLKKSAFINEIKFESIPDGQAKSSEAGSPDASKEAFREVKIDNLEFKISIKKN
ncbi:MAG: class I tRNA ligase family protein [Candidatus Paceibacterota bacterium]|jgi:isoleucyl-tRNA synthetase